MCCRGHWSRRKKTRTSFGASRSPVRHNSIESCRNCHTSQSLKWAIHFESHVWNRVWKSYILVWNRVRVFRSRRHTPTQKCNEYPPTPPATRTPYFDFRVVQTGACSSLLLAAWVGSLAVSSSGLLALITGKLCTIFGPRLVIATGAVLCAGGLLLTTQVTSITWMYLTYGGLFGLGSSCIYIATFVEVPKHFIKRRSLATALIAMGPGGGLFIMSPVVQALLDALHWRHALMTLAGMVTLCGILGCTYSKRLSDNRYDKPRLGDDDIALHRTGSEVTTPRNELSFLRNPLYVSVMLITAVSQMGHSVLPVHLVSFQILWWHRWNIHTHFSLGCPGLPVIPVFWPYKPYGYVPPRRVSCSSIFSVE